MLYMHVHTNDVVILKSNSNRLLLYRVIVIAIFYRVITCCVHRGKGVDLPL